MKTKDILRNSSAIVTVCLDKNLNLSAISRMAWMSYSHVVKFINLNPDIFILTPKGRAVNVSLSNKGVNAAKCVIALQEALK